MRTESSKTTAASAGKGQATDAVRPLAPEEIRTGDYVVILRETIEYPIGLLYCEPLLSDANAKLRVTMIPGSGGLPRRTEATYLPYVLTRRPDGQSETLDVRRHQLARVRKRTARAVWRALRKARKK